MGKLVLTIPVIDAERLKAGAKKIIRRMPDILVWACVVAGAWALFSFCYRAAVRTAFPYSVNLGEPALAQTIHRFAQGIIPYRVLDGPPYSLVPYGPVYLILSTAVGWFVPPFFAGPRIVTLAATLLISLLVYLILRRSGAGRPAAAVPALLFLALPYILRWGIQVNVDMSGVFWEVLALYLFYRHIQGGFASRRLWGLGLLCVTLGFFTKSSCMAAGASFFFFLLFGRRWKDALRYALVQGAVLLSVYGILNLLTRGQYFFHTTYEIGKRLFFYQHIGVYWGQTWENQGFLCVIAALTLLLPWVRRRFTLFYLYLFFSTLLTYSLGKQGSDTNYFLGFCASSVIALGLFMLCLPERFKRVLTAVIAGALLWQFLAYVPVSADLFKAGEWFEKKRKFNDALVQKIREVPGPVISWDMSLLLAAGKEVYFEPFPMAQMGYSGVWDQSIILEELRQHKISMALLYFYAPLLGGDRNFTPEFLKVFKKEYRCIAHIPYPWDKRDGFFIYVPKRGQVSL